MLLLVLRVFVFVPFKGQAHSCTLLLSRPALSVPRRNYRSLRDTWVAVYAPSKHRTLGVLDSAVFFTTNGTNNTEWDEQDGFSYHSRRRTRVVRTWLKYLIHPPATALVVLHKSASPWSPWASNRSDEQLSRSDISPVAVGFIPRSGAAGATASRSDARSGGLGQPRESRCFV